MADANGEPSPGKGSFFLSTFTRGDWIALAAATIAFLAFFGWITDVVSEANLAEVKTELALVKDSVEDAEANLAAAFAEHRTAVDGLVQDALRQRSDEIAQSLMAMWGDANSVVVRVANIPMADPDALAAIQSFAAEYGAGTTMMMFGDKAVIETQVDAISEAKAMAFQEVIESLSAYPAVQTEITFADTAQPAVSRN